MSACSVATGVRLSTPEGCDLGFYGCGDAGVPTGSRLRIVITAGGRWWSRSVYRAGPVQRAPLGPPRLLTGSAGQLFSDRLAAPRGTCRRPWPQKGGIGGLCPPQAEGPSDA